MIIRIWKKKENSQVPSHYIDPSGEMNPTGDITKEEMVEALSQHYNDNLYVHPARACGKQ